jgi:hypothetical protein
LATSITEAKHGIQSLKGDMDELRRELKLVLHEMRELRRMIEDCELCTPSKWSDVSAVNAHSKYGRASMLCAVNKHAPMICRRQGESLRRAAVLSRCPVRAVGRLIPMRILPAGLQG